MNEHVNGKHFETVALSHHLAIVWLFYPNYVISSTGFLLLTVTNAACCT